MDNQNFQQPTSIPPQQPPMAQQPVARSPSPQQPISQQPVSQQLPQTPISTLPAEKEMKKKKTTTKASQVVIYLLGVLEVLLGFRVVFKLLSPNSLNSFVQFVFRVSEPFVLPFEGIIGSTGTKAILEWSTLIAMFIYIILAWIIIGLIKLFKPASEREAEGI